MQINNRFAHVAPPLPRFSSDTMNGKEITAVAVVFMLVVLMPITIATCARLLKPLRHAPPPPADPLSNARLDRLEQAMDAIAIEIERISEGQRFVTKVLTDRPVQQPASQPGARDAAALAEGKPFLALGAGPMETIRTPERQGVRPSITPH
jgi:hypothetical protein